MMSQSVPSRFQRAKAAHDDLIAATHRAQADALEIEALAKRRLADEYDAAQERGEVATGREGRSLGVARDNARSSPWPISVCAATRSTMPA